MRLTIVDKLSTKDVLKTVYTYKRELSCIKQQPLDETWIDVLKDLVPNNSGVYENNLLKMDIDEHCIRFSCDDINSSKNRIRIHVAAGPKEDTHAVTIDYYPESEPMIKRFFPILSAKITDTRQFMSGLFPPLKQRQ